MIVVLDHGGQISKFGGLSLPYHHTPIVSHLSLEDVRTRFRTCKSNCVEKLRWQAIMLRMEHRTTAEVASICARKPDWVRRTIRRYNQDGPAGLKDRRLTNGKKRIMSAALMEELHHAVLDETPPGGGLWTGPKVAQWMSKRLGRSIYPQLAWTYLKRMKLSKQTPRPQNVKACKQAQTDFKKNSAAK